MSTRRAASVRARNRADLEREIVREARRQLAVSGAAGLSLRAVARELGMVSSAVYRYVASRDELLTLLIVDAYNAVADAAERAVAAVDPTDLPRCWRALCHAVRDWALAHPHEYALIYGSPVPGYRGNADTTRAAVRLTTLLAGLLRDAPPAAPRTDGEPPAALLAGMAELLASPVFVGPDGSPAAIPPTRLVRGLMAWVEVFGLVSFELFGQFANAIADPGALFDHAVELLGADMF